ncbi:hypothetical protein JAAARDRAFT_511841 [Jaapia argillacea MUCL 33604]|uniref:Pericentrin/AKAP-450 centrosomal targeting domain-containing protein n=1 Tax=Jaapia argillacea MUCL 33604 TaxID=933084 RepID=A0A067QFW6_9AGAM|nr:hypothetical protein JAAARDRAFT_511841 [Jaapia argillacea MUCL 33604]
MQGVQLETPSRIWRRIENIDDRSMPSLPSLPVFDDDLTSSDLHSSQDNLSLDSFPVQSTPAAASSHTHTVTSTIRPPNSTSSTTRFAHSIASRSITTRSALSVSGGRTVSVRRGMQDSFDEVSVIPNLPGAPRDSSGSGSGEEEEYRVMDESKRSLHDDYMVHSGGHPEDDEFEDLSLTDALESVSRSGSPYPTYPPDPEPTPKKNYDYSVSLRTETKPTPFDKLRNVSFRKPNALTRTRTPSLSRTTPSPTSSSSMNSTPRSTRSTAHFNGNEAASPSPATRLQSIASPAFIPLPRSTTASPANFPLPRSASASPAGLGIGGRRQVDDRSASASDEDPVQTEDDDGPQLPELPSHMMSEAHLSFSIPGPEQTDYQSQSNSHSRSHSHVDDHPTEDQSRSRTADEREPTFSSEEAPTQYTHSDAEQDRQNNLTVVRETNNAIRSPTPLSIAFSSPAGSAMFTPTPAFQPRPRARFNVPLSPAPLVDSASASEADEQEVRDEGEEVQEQEEEDRGQVDYDDPATPHAHKRSFLLSVINSTARPRMKFPTPHPLRVNAAVTGQPPPLPLPQDTPGGAKLFAGVTPRPARRPTAQPRRLSHPLSKTWTPKTPSDANTPDSGSESPYDATNDRASFISTASSHDLTTHARANASFDPLMGLGVGGVGVGRFNAGKLNTYLHGLNRRLQEENEGLVERLRVLEEEKKGGGLSDVVSAGAGARRVSGGGGRRVSAASSLGDVKEEEWVEEKAALEELVEELNEKFEGCVKEKEDVMRELEVEREGRKSDKDKWKDRMVEVEKGVEVIVKDLERKLKEAEGRVLMVEEEKQREGKRAERMLAELREDVDIAVQRAEKAEGLLDNGRELGSELRAANERVEKAMSELRQAHSQIDALQDEVMNADRRMEVLEKELREERGLSVELDEALRSQSSELASARDRLATAEDEAKTLSKALQDSKAYIAEIHSDAEAAVERLEELEHQLASANERIRAMDEDADQAADMVEKLEGEADRANELARQMEDALEAAEQKMLEDEQELAQIRVKVASLESELANSKKNIDPSQSIRPFDDGAEMEAMEAELDDAHREIARLNAVLNQSPARKAIESAKDSRISLLEAERDDLLERLKNMKNNAGTPSKLFNQTGISPMHRQVLNMTMASPRTPGGPLRDLTWLQNTPAEASVSPLLAEIARLQQELDYANQSIDDKLDKLEDAGLGVVELTRRLEDARGRISALEAELARLARRDDRRIRRLKNARCLKCKGKVDLENLNRAAEGDESSIDISFASFASEPPTPPTKTSEALRANLHSVNQQLESMKKEWDDEKRRLLGEKAVLQDVASRLNLQMQEANSEMRRVAQNHKAVEKLRTGVESELEKAKRTVNDLEAELRDERSRLRALTSERNRVDRDKGDIVAQLRRTESDMAEVRSQLQKVKQENHSLEAELRDNVNAEQKARRLEKKVTQNMEMIDQLREERSLLAADHKELQRRFSEVSEHVNKLRDQYTASQTSHENRRQQLDNHLAEIDELRRALSEQADELHRTAAEKNRMVAERTDIAQTVAVLEADLQRVKREAEAFGRDLKQLRAEKNRQESKHKDDITKAERAQKQSQTQIRVLTEQLESQRESAKRAKEEMDGHTCAA